jgi:metal-responsive CopG/Arc/MetJ family transcriptional regulator
MPKAKVTQTLVGLHKYQLDRLRAFSRSTGMSRSEIIRDAIDTWIDNNLSREKGNGNGKEE